MHDLSNEQKRFGNYAFLICLMIALSLCTVFKPQFHISVLNLRLSANAGLCSGMIRNASMTSQPLTTTPNIDIRPQTVERYSTRVIAHHPAVNLHLSEDTSLDSLVALNSSKIPHSFSPSHASLQSQTANRNQSQGLVNQPVETIAVKTNISCSLTGKISDYCEIEGDIRIIGNTSTIYLVSSNADVSAENRSWSIKPYARKENEGAMEHVRRWNIKHVDGQEHIPNCNKNHSTPAILFSTGGFAGNYFHAFSDVFVPLVTNSHIFRRKVHFLATDHKSWWFPKFQSIFNRLSEHDIVDIDREADVRCYKNIFVGLKSHKLELGIDTSKSPNGFAMKDFREFLRSTYSLGRKEVIKFRQSSSKKPRLMIISRTKTRRLMNEDNVVNMAQSSGYEVILVDDNMSTNLSGISQLVNSCDVLMGVHGAGLTNMIFLPDKAVVIQIIPFGGIDRLANDDFGEPAKDMNLKYLSYKISVKESSLIKEYPVDHAVIRDPMSLHVQGWDAIRVVYLDKQNVILNPRRFRATLIKALKLVSQ